MSSPTNSACWGWARTPRRRRGSWCRCVVLLASVRSVNDWKMPCTSGYITSTPSTMTVGQHHRPGVPVAVVGRRSRPGLRRRRTAGPPRPRCSAHAQPPRWSAVRRPGRGPIGPAPVRSRSHSGGVVRDDVALERGAASSRGACDVLALDQHLGGHLVERGEEQAALGDPRRGCGHLERGLPGGDLLVVADRS